MPDGIAAAMASHTWWRDRIGESGCAVYRLAGPDGRDLYLKHGTGPFADDAFDEAARLRWLAGRLPVPTVRAVAADPDGTWVLTDAIGGRTAWQLLDAEPAGRGVVVDALADFLRRLHALPVDRCPFAAGHELRLAHARERLAAGLIDEEDFGDEHTGWSAERLVTAMTALLPIAAERVVTHGDFSLDNLILRDGAVAGCIDVGRLGVADPYQDIAILWSCLGEFDAALQRRFVERYGIVQPDERRLRFHLMLDECF